MLIAFACSPAGWVALSPFSFVGPSRFQTHEPEKGFAGSKLLFRVRGYLEILGFHPRGAVGGPIMRRPLALGGQPQRALAFFIKCREGLCRTVISAPVFHHLGRREMGRRRSWRGACAMSGDAVLKPVSSPSPVAHSSGEGMPAGGGTRAGCLEYLADEAGRHPVGHNDAIPAGWHTRISSAATALRARPNMAPNMESTRSKLPSL